jgi:hypothetical protein
VSPSASLSPVQGNRDLDFEKDSLHIMPLHILPLKTPGLMHARMIKNVHFDSMIELFHDSETGSGQVEPSRLGRMFDWPPGEKCLSPLKLSHYVAS